MIKKDWIVVIRYENGNQFRSNPTTEEAARRVAAQKRLDFFDTWIPHYGNLPRADVEQLS